ncbi:hypothetical protein DSCO28_44370 [Desulfosarcina ovata subsp. sediminis]|uniref:Response regulator n=2 Tax=Desulfosarcina ovata TaxID=83564 RepID=A0A5K7ZUN0_9BACT|nr:hypothetical protein DSCO28_44370 [Desulfosarcina ovata subsp. sediminis]
MRILIVDNDASSIAVTVSCLQPFGACEEASDRDTALARFKDAIDGGTPYQLVLVDINATDADGEPIVVAFRDIETQSHLAVAQQAYILVTATSCGRQMITDCLMGGGDDFFTKPLDKTKLVGKLHARGLLAGGASASSGPANVLDADDLLKQMSRKMAKGDPVLPPAMKIAMRIRQLIDCGAEIADVANLLRQDTAISTRLIKTSNSAFYRGVEKSTTVDQAISRLGLSRASEVVMSICCRGFFATTHPPYQGIVERLWWHSLACAHTTQMPFLNPDEKPDEDLFSIGLIHDIGKLLLLQAAAEVEQRRHASHQPPVSVEELVGLMNEHHVRFGNTLLEKMEAPDMYAKLIQRHHDTNAAGKKYSRSLKILQQANWLAKLAGFGLEPVDGQSLAEPMDALEIDESMREQAILEIPQQMEQLRYLFG